MINGRTVITEYCSETTYFRHDLVDEQGVSHVFLIGGDLDSIGWAEILFLENGKRVSHTHTAAELIVERADHKKEH